MLAEMDQKLTARAEQLMETGLPVHSFVLSNTTPRRASVSAKWQAA
jgi:hypothetical protein